MRPRTLDEFLGQEKLLGPGRPLRLQIEREHADDPQLDATLQSMETGSGRGPR